MAKGSMKSIWNDRKREAERLQKVTAKKKAGALGNPETAAESPAGQKSEEEQGK